MGGHPPCIFSVAIVICYLHQFPSRNLGLERLQLLTGGLKNGIDGGVVDQASGAVGNVVAEYHWCIVSFLKYYLFMRGS